MSENKEKQTPDAEQPQEEPVSFFELIVPKKNYQTEEQRQEEAQEKEAEKKYQDRLYKYQSMTGFKRFWYHPTTQKYVRLLLFCLAAFLFMFIANRYFGVGNKPLRNLAPDNVARIIVFPHCSYEMLESNTAAYPGVIGAVAAYGEETGELEGYAYDLYCQGEGGEVLLTLGIRIDGTITGLSVTAHKESRGLGTSAGNLFIGSFAGLAADEAALDGIAYMDSTPETSKAIVDVVRQAVRHAQDTYGIVGRADEALHEAMTEDIRENNTFDTTELQQLLPGATFAGYYPDKDYPIKGFEDVTMAYIAQLDDAEYYAFDMTTAGQEGDIVLSVAITSDWRVANILVHSQQEAAFAESDRLEGLLNAIIGCDKLALNQLDVDYDARFSCNAVINAALEAIDCAKSCFQ